MSLTECPRNPDHLLVAHNGIDGSSVLRCQECDGLDDGRFDRAGR